MSPDSFVSSAILQAEIFITKSSNKRQLRPLPPIKVEKIIFPYISKIITSYLISSY